MRMNPADITAQSLAVCEEANTTNKRELFPYDKFDQNNKFGNADPARPFPIADRSMQVARYVEDTVQGMVRAPRLVEAASENDVEVFAKLLYSGADPNSRSPVTNGLEDLDTRNHWVNSKVAGSSAATSLHVCAAMKTDEARTMTNLALDYKADINAILDPNKDTPLHIAAYSTNMRIVELLVERKAAIDPVNAWDHTPFTLSVVKGHFPTALKLLDLKADVLHQVRCEDIRQKPLYPLELAFLFNHGRLGEKFIKPLHEAAMLVEPEVIPDPPAGWTREYRGGVPFLVNSMGNFRREDMKTKMNVNIVSLPDGNSPERSPNRR
jgi:hypothetical protein